MSVTLVFGEPRSGKTSAILDRLSEWVVAAPDRNLAVSTTRHMREEYIRRLRPHRVLPSEYDFHGRRGSNILIVEEPNSLTNDIYLWHNPFRRYAPGEQAIVPAQVWEASRIPYIQEVVFVTTPPPGCTRLSADAWCFDDVYQIVGGAVVNLRNPAQRARIPSELMGVYGEKPPPTKAQTQAAPVPSRYDLIARGVVLL